jgi:hypothetical protein
MTTLALIGHAAKSQWRRPLPIRSSRQFQPQTMGIHGPTRGCPPRGEAWFSFSRWSE